MERLDRFENHDQIEVRFAHSNSAGAIEASTRRRCHENCHGRIEENV